MTSKKISIILSLLFLTGGIYSKDNFERFKVAGKVAVVTGASSDIGLAITIELLKEGINVVGIYDSVNDLEQIIAKELPKEQMTGKFHAKKCDITDEEKLTEVFKWIELEEISNGIGIMINGAESDTESSLLDGKTKDWLTIMSVNVIALCSCTKKAYKSMTDHKFDGHIIHINSTAGHSIVGSYGHKMYNASKFAVTTLADGMRHELQLTESKVKVTSVSPKFIETKPKAAEKVQLPVLEPKHVADLVMSAINTPPEVLIAELIVVPVGIPIQEHIEHDFHIN